jgi:predicted phage terminase large subunit-like protein
MSIQSAKFKRLQVFFPNRAPWLADLETELFAFPNARHDDQVDSISQTLAHQMSGYGGGLVVQPCHHTSVGHRAH